MTSRAPIGSSESLENATAEQKRDSAGNIYIRAELLGASGLRASTVRVEEAVGGCESGHRGLHFHGESAPAASDIYFLKNTVYRFLVLVRQSS